MLALFRDPRFPSDEQPTKATSVPCASRADHADTVLAYAMRDTAQRAHVEAIYGPAVASNLAPTLINGGPRKPEAGLERAAPRVPESASS